MLIPGIQSEVWCGELLCGTAAAAAAIAANSAAIAAAASAVADVALLSIPTICLWNI